MKQVNDTVVQRPALVVLRYLELLWVKCTVADVLAHVFLEIQLSFSSTSLCIRKVVCENLFQWEAGTQILL